MSSSQAEQQLILLSAGIAAHRQDRRERARGLMGEVDWSRLAETLRLRKLLPALGPRILELAEGQPSEDFAAAVGQALEAGRRQSALLQLISLRLMAMLAEAGICCKPLKGPMLGEAIYGDPGRRLSSDIDLLVAPEQLQAAVEVVRGLGYQAPTDHVGRRTACRCCTSCSCTSEGSCHRWSCTGVCTGTSGTSRRSGCCHPRLISPAAGVRNPSTSSPALLLFYARDGFIDLRLATDLSAWWDVYGVDCPPGGLDQLLSEYPALARVISAAIEAAEQIVGLPARKVIGDRNRLGIRGRMAVRLANPNPHSSVSQLYADIGLIDGLLTPPGDFGAFVRRQVLPPREVIDQQARHASRRRVRCRLSRGVGVLVRYGLRWSPRSPRNAALNVIGRLVTGRHRIEFSQASIDDLDASRL